MLEAAAGSRLDGGAPGNHGLSAFPETPIAWPGHLPFARRSGQDQMLEGMVFKNAWIRSETEPGFRWQADRTLVSELPLMRRMPRVELGFPTEEGDFQFRTERPVGKLDFLVCGDQLRGGQKGRGGAAGCD